MITGHEHKDITRVFTELGITDIYQEVKDNVLFLNHLIVNNNIDKSELAYIGMMLMIWWK